MKKRLLCAVLAFVIIFSFSSCAKKASYPISAEDVHVSSGIFAYYLDKIMSSPEDYSVKSDSKEEYIEKAAQLCREYIALQKYMKSNGFSMTQELKSEVAQNTESMWSLFGKYYSSIGVEKPDITNVNTFEMQKLYLLSALYGKGGKKEVSDDDLKQKFVEMYVGFKGFEGTFTKQNVKGETVEMTDKEKEKQIEKFRKMAQKVSEGTSIDDVYADYCRENGLVATNELEVIIMKDKDPMYADDFFKKVSTISYGKAAPVTSGTSIYVVERCTIATSDEDAFEKYRTTVLREMKMSAIDKLVSKLAAEIQTETNKNETERIYSVLAEVRKGKQAS